MIPDYPTLAATPWDWRQRGLALHARLGEVNVARFPLRLRVREAPLTESLAGCVPTLDNLPPLDREGDGFLIRCAAATSESRQLIRNAGWLIYRQPAFDRCYFSFEGGHAAYLDRFSAKTLSTIRRKARKLAQADGGRADFRIFQGIEGLTEFHAVARQVSQLSYQERLLRAGFPEDPEFKQMMLALAARGDALGYVMYAQGAPIAYLYCPIWDGTVVYDYLGYDPKAARFSPGTVLLWHAIEDMFARKRFLQFDFGEGDSEHKRLFSTAAVRCQNVYVLPRNLRNESVVAFHRLLASISSASGRALERVGLKSRIRTWVREGWVGRRHRPNVLPPRNDEVVR